MCRYLILYILFAVCVSVCLFLIAVSVGATIIN